MAKFYGAIGFAEQVEEKPGDWRDHIVDRKYSGDFVRNFGKTQSSDKVNDDINIDCQISILSDPYANENFHSMRYAEFMGTKWKITSVEVQYPRLILTIGGVYNAGQT